MAGGGGKGGKTTERMELPPELQKASVGALGGGMAAASLPYAPNRGVSIAAFTPQEMAAFQGANSAASAFGLPTGGVFDTLPKAERGAGGIAGYSTGALYDQIKNQSMSPQEQQARSNILSGYGNIAEQLGFATGMGGSGKGGGGAKKPAAGGGSARPAVTATGARPAGTSKRDYDRDYQRRYDLERSMR